MAEFDKKFENDDNKYLEYIDYLLDEPVNFTRSFSDFLHHKTSQ